MKIKYQGTITKILASNIANINRNEFSRFINESLKTFVNEIKKPGKINIELVSFSSSKDFAEQILSILSFLRYVGIPNSWILYTDGSHSKIQIDFLCEAFYFLEVRQISWHDLEELPNNTKPELLPYSKFFLDYAKKLPLGKKLFYYLNHRIMRPTIFLDSDILFYDKGTIFDKIVKDKYSGYFLPDAKWGCLDSRYKLDHNEEMFQVNGGFFILNENLINIENGLNFFKNINFSYEYFSEQTIFHILLRDNNFMPLDPRIFILNSSDQFDFSYLYQREDMAIRHYTSPVRHKMWQKNYKWHLGLK